MFGKASSVLGAVRNTVLRLTLVVILLAFPSVASADICKSISVTGSDLSLNAGANYGSYAGTYAQIFTPDTDCYLQSVDFQVQVDAGAPSDGVDVNLWSVVGVTPTTILESGTSLDTTIMTGSYTTQSSSFAGTTLLLAGTDYAISIARGGSFGSYDNSNFVGFQAGSGNTIKASNDNGTSWGATDQVPQSFTMIVNGSSGTSTPSGSSSSSTSTPEQLMAMTLLVFTTFLVFGGSIVFALWIFLLLV